MTRNNFSSIIYPKDIYMSPRKAIQRWSQILERCHPEAVNTGSKYYRLEKEALDAAIFLFGIQSMNGINYWLRNAEDITLDNDVQVIEEVSRVPVLYIKKTASLQITQFESHNRSIIDVLNKKQKPGYNPGEVELLIVARDKQGWEFLPADLANEVRQTNPKYKAVWLLTEDGHDKNLYHLIQLYPNQIQANYKFIDLLNNNSNSDFVRELPKFSKYIVENGELNLPLPPCVICGNE